ncbi:amidohydrolase family protein [Streptomyces flaveolus]|uniref:amidohydrolase family protein n=1 Tax=Streptomyces flaveolus TaxID=67297 RepID=UPI00342376F0
MIRPDRFGFFATLTLPDVEGAVAEAGHALDELGADGVVLLANSKGVYLGDSAFDPLMDALNRRSAVVFVHPSALPADPAPDCPLTQPTSCSTPHAPRSTSRAPGAWSAVPT